MAGIYIHIPFCKQACTYCNFHFSTNLEKKQTFLKALENEICAPNDFVNPTATIETIYFGGGTPSLLKTVELDKILDIISGNFSVNSDAEITLEANPDDINNQILREWMNAGINRLSVGIQSFDDEELKWMNRAHNAEQSINCIRQLKESGLANFSADLIFGGPLLSNKQLEKNINIMTEHEIPHISAYALTVEEKTALHHFIKTKQSPAMSSEKQATQFMITMKALAAAGYEQYEISNYARPGMRSQHNSSYWRGKPYYGFGPSSHSYNGINIRRWNVSNNSLYINNWLNNRPASEEEVLTEKQQLNEYIMTSLRTIEGMDLEFVEDHFGQDKKEIVLIETEKMIVSGDVILNQNHVLLTAQGKLFADGIAASLFF